MELVAEKAQHEPHCAWFLTGLTAPRDLQSLAAGTPSVERMVGSLSVTFFGALNPRSFLYSSGVQVDMKL